MTTPAAPTDGRTARSLRTRDAVVEAFLSLMDDGHLRPTAKQVSERAGVSIRSVFQHFADLETLFAAASDRQIERMTALVQRAHISGTFDERLAAFVDTRSAVLEAISPVRRAAVLAAPFSAEIAGRLGWFRTTNREEVDRVFAEEIAAVPEGERGELAAALHVATEWYTWEMLRVHEDLDVEPAKRVMSRTIRVLLKKEDL